jgi:hypothetical protein
MRQMSETERRAYPNTNIADVDRRSMEIRDWRVRRTEWTPEGFIVTYERGEDWAQYRTAFAILAVVLIVLVVVVTIAKSLGWL